MAGIGGYPPVIEVPKDTRWEALGQGLGNIAGSIFDAWNTSDTMQKANKMWPTNSIEDLSHKQIYLQSRLGEKGGKLVAQQMDLLKTQASLKESEATIRRSDALTASAKIEDQLHLKQLQWADAEAQAKIRAENASAAASAASAAGAGPLAAMHSAEARRANMEAEKAAADLKSSQDNSRMFQDLMKRELSGEGGSGATVQPQSYTVPGQGDSTNGDTTGRPPIRPIGTGDIVVPGAPGAKATSATDVPPNIVDEPSRSAPTGDGSFNPRRIMEAEKYVGQPITTKPVNVPLEVWAAASMEAKRDPAKAFQMIGEARMPKDIYEAEVVPGSGLYARRAVFADGREAWVPGAIVHSQRKPTPEAESSASIGAAQWYGSNKILQNLNKAQDDGSDPLGNAAVRRINQLFYNNNWGLPVGDQKNLAYYVMVDQSRIGLDQLMKGVRETDQFRKLLDATQPSATASLEVRQQRLRAMELAADFAIKSRVENAMANQQEVPPALKQIYANRGLDKVDSDSLTQGFIEDLNKQQALDSGADTSTPAGRGGGAPGKSAPAPAGKSYKTPYGNVTITPD